jgi:hypothetical protein
MLKKVIKMPNNNDYIRLVVNEPSSTYSGMVQPTKTNLGEITATQKPTNNIQVTQKPIVTPKPTTPQSTVQPVSKQTPAPGSDWKSMGMGLLGIAAVIALLYLPTRRR